MLKYLILFGFIFLCFGCYEGRTLYKEKTKEYNVRIFQHGAGFNYIGIHERKRKEHKIIYVLYFECSYIDLTFKYKKEFKSRQSFGDQELYPITDTNGGYFRFGRKVADKSDSIVFQPLTENEKRWLKIASEKTTFDSCKYFNPSQIIGFIPKPQGKF